MFNWAIPLILAFGVGVTILVQQVINADLRNGLNSVAVARFVS